MPKRKPLIQDVLGPLVQRLRKDVGMSQGQLGKLLHLHQAGVSRVEKGFQLLTPDQFVLLYRMAMSKADLRIRAEWRYMLTGDDDIFAADIEAAEASEKLAEEIQKSLNLEDERTRRQLGAG